MARRGRSDFPERRSRRARDARRARGCPRSPTSRTHQVERHLERDRLPREGRASRARVSDDARDFRRSGIARVARSRATTTETSSSSAPRPFENRDDGRDGRPPGATTGPRASSCPRFAMDHAWYTRDVAEMQLGVASARTSGLPRSPRSWPWRTWRWRACAVCRARWPRSSAPRSGRRGVPWRSRSRRCSSRCRSRRPRSFAPPPRRCTSPRAAWTPGGSSRLPGAGARRRARAPSPLSPGLHPRAGSPPGPRPSAAEISRDAFLRVALVAAHAAPAPRRARSSRTPPDP